MTETIGEVKAKVVRASALTTQEIAAWRAMQAATPAFASPLLGPAFARAVGEVRADVRVAVIRRDAEPLGFLAYHRRPHGFARPIGAPFCDYHALIAHPDAGFTPAEALKAAGLVSLRLTALVDTFGMFGESTTARHRAYRIALDEGAPDGEAWLSSNGAHPRKNHRRYRRLLEQDVGPVRLVADDRSEGAFNRLLAWKQDQFHRTGLHDLLAVPWARTLLTRLFERRGDGLRGQMISLYAGPRLVAAHFGVREGAWFHPWLSAYDRAFKAYSPGAVHLVEAILAMREAGIATYDLGPGEDHWKQRFCHGDVWVNAGLATTANLAGALALSRERFWALGPLAKTRLVGRVRRRMEQIASLELTLGGRVQAAASAIGAQRMRS